VIHHFGPQYRLYRLAIALDRLRDMPSGTMLTLTKAAHLLGTNEATLRRVIARYAQDEQLEGNRIRAATLRAVVRKAHDERKK
jgi:hypothetical protein